ncbi:MAG: hypothetical protein RQ735_08075 [Flavobacteriaceae bacterium]|nr:hypothetical protein [Flavobacteriaceae bacterium]
MLKFFAYTFLILTVFQTFGQSHSRAEVLGVEVSGKPNNYRFSVSIKSPDLGCKQYADWWEVISANGQTLFYRRILMHSHTDEQPFTRLGGPVKIDQHQKVIIRVHMNNSGYSTEVFSGSVATGFEKTQTKADFALDFAQRKPLPKNCAF